MGNIRLSYFSNGSSPEILAENNFYPFGLKHEGNNYIYANPAYNYDYNGKEVQIETGMLDYGWRQYMPDLGRWTGMDMLSEIYQSSSPYAYVMNNPVMLTDPDGRKVIPTEPLVNGLFEGGALWDNMTGGSRLNEFMEEFWSGESKPLGGGGGGDDEEEEDRGVDNNGQGSTNTVLVLNFFDLIRSILGDDGDCPTCPKNAKEGQIYPPQNGKFIDTFNTHVFKDGEWVTWVEANAIMGTVDIGPASGGKFLIKMMKNSNFVESSVKQVGKFWEYSAKIAGKDGSFTKYYRYFNSEGKTIKFFHDTYNSGYKFLHREYMMGSERMKIWWDGSRQWFSKWK